MAEEFQTGICPGIWWNSSRSSLGTSPCSVTLGDIGSFGWSSSADVMVARSNSTCDNPPQPVDSSGVLMDSTLQMLGFGLSPPSSASDWNNNQTLLEGGCERSEGNYNSMMQEDMNSRFNNYRQERDSHHHIQTDWLSKNFVDNNDEDDSTIDVFKPINLGFSTSSSSGDETATVTTCQGLSTSFPMSSYSSTLVQSLFVDDDHEPQHQQQQSSFDNNSSINNYQSSLFSNSNWPKVSPNFPKPSLPKQQQLMSNNHHLHFSNNTTYWNASAAAMNNDHIPASCFPSSQQSQFLTPSFEEKPNHANLTAKPNNEEVRDTGSLAKKSNNEPAFKRPRIETPSPLPTFKVRKEKLGDRITALQQLVSPFGKTDTASVLHEAIEYIKFLHDQVSVLSTPYMKNGSPTNNLQQHQQNLDKSKDSEGQKQDLRSRGLCLVPISSTLSTADFWTPTFGGTFR